MQSNIPTFLSDLDLAINRLDFYRLFKVLCVQFDFELLMLVDMNNWPDENHIEALMVVINSDKRSDLDLDTISVDPENLIFGSLRNSMLCSKWSSDEIKTDFDFCSNLDGMTVFSAPMHTPHGRHFGFCVLSQTNKIQKHAPETIKYCLDLVFDRFFQKIILPVTLPTISSRELEVIRWSSEGKTSVEIAIILGLSEHTINSYTTKILQKLHVVNRAQMVAKAIRMGLIQ